MRALPAKPFDTGNRSGVVPAVRVNSAADHASERGRPRRNPQVAAGFFLDFAGLGSTTAPGARSIDVSRPPVKV
jgi:hypothetical protein